MRCSKKSFFPCLLALFFVAAFSFVGPEGAVEVESNPAVTPVETSVSPAMVVNFGRDGNTCQLFDPSGNLAGMGRSTEVFNGNRFHLHCNGDFLPPPPPQTIRDAVGCPGGATGSIVITPGGTFAARCNGAF